VLGHAVYSRFRPESDWATAARGRDCTRCGDQSCCRAVARARFCCDARYAAVRYRSRRGSHLSSVSWPDDRSVVLPSVPIPSVSLKAFYTLDTRDTQSNIEPRAAPEPDLRGVSAKYRYGPCSPNRALRASLQSLSTHAWRSLCCRHSDRYVHRVRSRTVSGDRWCDRPSSRRDPGWLRRCRWHRLPTRWARLRMACPLRSVRRISRRLGLTRPLKPSLAGKLAFLFDPVGVAILAVATLIIGTVGFSLGYLSQWSINRIKNNSPMNSQQ